VGHPSTPALSAIRSVGVDKGEHCVQSDPQRPGGALNLTEEEAALQGGQQGDGEIIGVGGGDEVTRGLHGAQAVSDGIGPAPETSVYVEAGIGVGLGEFAPERADGAAAPAAKLVLNFNDRCSPSP
jgi:hypothetical protein